MELLLGVSFYLAGALSIASFISVRKNSRIIRMFPVAAILITFIYFVLAEIYYSQDDIAVTVPIRVDLLILPLFLIAPVGIEVRLRFKKAQPVAGGDATR